MVWSAADHCPHPHLTPLIISLVVAIHSPWQAKNPSQELENRAARSACRQVGVGAVVAAGDEHSPTLYVQGVGLVVIGISSRKLC
jgi:hypothetical protein